MPPRSSRILARLAAAPALLVIGVYRWCVSPFMPPTCRYTPTCSEYAREAILRHGPIAGGMLAARRLARCHPWGGSGVDPVPEPPFPTTPLAGSRLASAAETSAGAPARPRA